VGPTDRASDEGDDQAGAFAGQIDFGNGVLTSAGETDIFVARLPSP